MANNGTNDAQDDTQTMRSNDRVPLNKLVAWEHNPRRSRDPQQLRQRAKNLLEQGQLMPLIVVASESGDTFQVIDGESRRLEMNINVDDGAVEPDVMMDVKFLDPATPLPKLLAISMTINIMRNQMNPIEEMEGFRALEQAGMTRREIADIYNLTIKQVSQRISLGSLVEKARDLVRTGVRQIGWAEAMTTGSPVQQEKIVAEIAANPAAFPDRSSVHTHFNRGNIPAESALFDVTMLKDCTVVDLFSHGTGGGSFNDPDAFWKLQLPEVEKIADRLRATHKDVRIHDRKRFNDAGWTSGGDPATSIAVIVTFDDGSVVVREGMVPPAHQANIAPDAIDADDADFLSGDDLDDLTVTSEAPVVRIETGPLDTANKDTMGYLNAQVVGGLKVQVASDARKAMAFVIAATLTRNGGLASSMQISGVGIDAKAQTSETFVRLTALRSRRDAIAKEAGVLGVTSPAKVVDLLLRMDESDLGELFAWTVAESVSTSIQNATTFDLVEVLGGQPMPGWCIEEAYLDTLSSAQTRALASEVVPVAEQPSRNAPISQVRRSIVQAVEVDALQSSWVDGSGWTPSQIGNPMKAARERAEASAVRAATATDDAVPKAA